MMRFVTKTLAAAFLALCATSVQTAAGQETVIHNFAVSGGADGASPFETLIIDSKGNLFGTTLSGGQNSNGTVYELSPLAGGGFAEKVIHAFGISDANDGSGPRGALVLDSAENLYGSTLFGGLNNSGTVFELSPAEGGSWQETILYNFGSQDSDGYLPVGNLVHDAQGNIYGVSVYGGANSGGGAGGLGYGTVFELTPSAGGGWTQRTIHSFGEGVTDGVFPRGGLAIDSAGHIFGTTSLGGSHSDRSTFGGTVYELLPASDGSWTETILHEFDPADGDGSYPMANLILDSRGDLYGTTMLGGKLSGGTAFKLSPSTGAAWPETVFSFSSIDVTGDSASGYGPTAGLTIDSAGNLYGTTVKGGPNATPGSGSNAAGGVVFKLTPKPDGTFTEVVLHGFPATTGDGSAPHGGVIFDATGTLYGATASGGSHGTGTVFAISSGEASATITTLVASPDTNLVAGDPITLTASVAAMGGTSTPSGSVTFSAVLGGSITVHLNQAGLAVYHGFVPRAGTYSVYAHYNGAPGLPASTSAVVTSTVTARSSR